MRGCAGSLLRTRLQARIPCYPGKNREFQPKQGFSSEGRWRETAIAQPVSGQIPYAQKQGIFSVLVGKIREKTRIWSGSVTLVMQSKDFQAFVARLGDLSESQRQVVVAAKVTVKLGQVH